MVGGEVLLGGPEARRDPDPPRLGPVGDPRDLVARLEACLGHPGAAGLQIGLAPGREEDHRGPPAASERERLAGQGLERRRRASRAPAARTRIRCDVGGRFLGDGLGQGVVQPGVRQVPHVQDAAVTADDDVLGGDAQVQGVGQFSVVDDHRHGQPHGLAIAADGVPGLVEVRVDRDDLNFAAQGALHVLEVRHLQAAGHAPGGPELQIDRLVAIEFSEVDLLAVQGRQGDGRGVLADEGHRSGLDQLLAGRVPGLDLRRLGVGRDRRRLGAGEGEDRQGHQQGPGLHRGLHIGSA